MGSSNSRSTPPVLTTCKAPMYCIKKLGGRHLLLGGGGGAAKTGVPNQMESHLISFKKTVSQSATGMCAQLSNTIGTEQYATMNMDVVCVGNPESGRYLIAAGHDSYCDIYETGGYNVSSEHGDNVLAYNFTKIARISTDEKVDGYQKCVRFDKASRGQKLVTGGSDGYLRVWDVKDIVNNRNPEIVRKPITEIRAHQGDIDDVDISPDGRIIMSIGTDGVFSMWDMMSGKKIQDLEIPAVIGKGYRVRSARYTALGGNNIIFVVAYNCIQRTSKSSCFLALWAYNRERQVCKPVIVKEARKGESISALCVSSCGNFTGIGTLGGSVGIFDTHEMKPLQFFKETHGIFVTGVEFLSRVAEDVVLPSSDGSKRLIPGVAAGNKASLVSLSADQTVQVHALPFDSAGSPSAFLCKIAILSLVLYFLLWTFSGF
ncbi:unnamed protein product [Auanema sp. JU1783]|nr:unnamed protein product [Auanema sp. JU1783]